MRTREDPAAGLWIRVDEDLQVGKEVRDALHFVDDCPFGKLAQEASGVLRGESAYIRSFKRRVRMLRKHGCAQGGLAALRGPVSVIEGNC